jgi:hypothetical protein
MTKYKKLKLKVKEKEIEFEYNFANLFTAIEIIKEKHGNNVTESIKGSISCPQCKVGTIHYIISSYIKHLDYI